jgi:tetratricopeptide (TPR) repeat protein
LYMYLQMRPRLPFLNQNSLLMKKSIIIILLLIFTFIAFAQKPKDYYLSGMAKMKTGKMDSAVYFLDQAIMEEPDSYKYYLRRGEAKYSIGRYNEALLDFKTIDPLRISLADLWLAKCYARLNNRDLAVEYLKSYLQSDSKLPLKEIKKDEAFDQLQLTEEWYQIWQTQWYSQEESLKEDIDYLINQGNYLGALTLIDEKLKDSNNPQVLYQYRAQIEVMQGNYRAASMDWTEVINENKNDYTLYKERGLAYLKSKKFKESVNDLSKAIRMESADFNLYLLRAEAYKGVNDLKSAIGDLSFYMSFFPDDVTILYFLGELQYIDEKYVDALRSFNKCLMHDDSNSDYYKARGKTYYQTGLYKYAIDDLSMSLDLNATDGETYYYKGMARFYSGDKSGACDDWKESASLGEVKSVEQLIRNCQ